MDNRITGGVFVINRTEEEERQHLEVVLTKLNKEFETLNDKI